MNCKNCDSPITDSYKFCPECGAEIVKERVTLKRIFGQFFTVIFGWDSKFMLTFKGLWLRPHEIFKAFIDGTRKKYVNPFSFFAIGVAFSIIIFNVFSDQFLKFSSVKVDTTIEAGEGDQDQEEMELAAEEYSKRQEELNKKVQQTLLKYYNIYSFLLLPVYTLIAFLVYWKPYNYAEHLSINAYIQGLLLFVTVFLFGICAITGLSGQVYNAASILLMVGFYLYSYSRFYKHSFGKMLLMFLKFIGVFILATLVLALATAVAVSIVKLVV